MQYHQRTRLVIFVCGAVLEDHWRETEQAIESRTEPCGTPVLWFTLVAQETVHVDLNYTTN